MFRRLLATTAVLLFAASSPAAPMDERIPGDALLYVGWRGGNDLGPGYGQSRLKEIVDATNVKELFGPYLQRVTARLTDMDDDAGAVAQVLATAADAFWRFPSALYVGPPAEGGNEPVLAILCQAGDQAPALARQWEEALAAAGPAPAPIRIVVNVSTVAIVIGHLPIGHAPRLGLGLAPGMANVPSSRSLADDAGFKSAGQQINRDGVMTVYLNVEGILTVVDAQVQKMAAPAAAQQPGGAPPMHQRRGGPDQQFAENWPKVRDALGLAGVKRLIVSAGFEGKDWATSAFIEAAAPRTGLVSLLSGEPASDDALGVVPATAAIATVSRFSIAQFYDVIDQALGDIEPAFQQQLHMFEQQGSAIVGTPLRQDLLGSLGDEWVAYTDSGVGGSNVMGFVLVNRLRDPAKAEQALLRVQATIEAVVQQQLAEAPIQLRFRQTEQDGVEVHYLAVPAVAPAWAIQGEYLYVSLYPQNVLAAAAFTRSGQPNLGRNREFLALRERLGGAKAGGFQYYDIVQNGDDGYVTLVGMVQLLTGLSDLFGVESPALLMPPLHKLRPHFQKAMAVTWVDDRGWHLRSVSPFPAAEIVATQGNSAVFQQLMMVAGMAGPAMQGMPMGGRGQQHGQQMEIATRARAIHQSAVQYSTTNNGVMPPDLYTLVEQNYFTLEYAMHPEWEVAPPPDFEQWPREQKVEWLEENADFVYLGKDQPFTADAQRIVVYQKFWTSDGTIAVCFDDNHVENLPMEEARQRIMDQTGEDPMGDAEIGEEDWMMEEEPAAPPPAPFR